MNRRRFLGTVLTAPAVPLIAIVNSADVATRTADDETTLQVGGLVAYVPRTTTPQDMDNLAEALLAMVKDPNGVLVLPDDVRLERLR